MKPKAIKLEHDLILVSVCVDITFFIVTQRYLCHKCDVMKEQSVKNHIFTNFFIINNI